MAERYYFSIRYLPENANESLLAGRCMSIFHGFILENELTGIGVSFPDWSCTSIGKYIAFVSDNKVALQYLLSQRYFNLMASEGFFELTKVLGVPAGCREIRFKRNQRISKLFVNEKRRRLLRAKRRALARGEEYVPVPSLIPQDIGLFHCIKLSSKSNKQKFLLNVQMEESVEQICMHYNHYGLATNKDYRGSVPDLSGVVKSPYFEIY